MSAYNEAVRHYTIKMMSGFAKFNCLVCKHSVTTREFSSQNGSCRTQAARAMNEHATVAHGRPLPFSPRVAQSVVCPLNAHLTRSNESDTIRHQREDFKCIKLEEKCNEL